MRRRAAPVVSGNGRFPYTAMRRRPGRIIASERMVKEQLIRLTPRGARLLLQVRTRVRNDQPLATSAADTRLQSGARSSGAHGVASPVCPTPTTAVAYLR